MNGAQRDNEVKQWPRWDAQPRSGNDKRRITILPPEATDTDKPISHSLLANSLLESLAFRHINIVEEEYAVSQVGI